MIRKCQRFFTCSGSPYREIYKEVFVKERNCFEPQVVGKENFQAYIQSFESSCDLAVIAQRVANGELGLLNSRPGMYGDFTQAPTTLAEVLQTRIDAKNMFENLPEDVRKKFGDLDTFLEGAGSIEWLKTLGFQFDSGSGSPSAEIKTDSNNEVMDNA